MFAIYFVLGLSSREACLLDSFHNFDSPICLAFELSISFSYLWFHSLVLVLYNHLFSSMLNLFPSSFFMLPCVLWAHYISSYDDLKPPTSPSPSAPTVSLPSTLPVEGGSKIDNISGNNTAQPPAADIPMDEQHYAEAKPRPLSPFTMWAFFPFSFLFLLLLDPFYVDHPPYPFKAFSPLHAVSGLLLRNQNLANWELFSFVTSNRYEDLKPPTSPSPSQC